MFASRRWQHFFSIFFVSSSFPNCVHYDDSSQSKPCLNWPPAFQRNQRFVTQVRVDVLVLSSGGNLLDSLALALCAVLSETLLPKARCNLVNTKKIAPKKTPRIYICSKIYAIKVLKISPNSERAWGGMCWTSNPPQQNPQEVAVGKGFGGDALVTGGGHWGHGRRWRGATEGGEPLEGWGEVVVRDKMVGMGLNYLNTPKNYSSPNWILFKGFSIFGWFVSTVFGGRFHFPKLIWYGPAGDPNTLMIVVSVDGVFLPHLSILKKGPIHGWLGDLLGIYKTQWNRDFNKPIKKDPY